MNVTTTTSLKPLSSIVIATRRSALATWQALDTQQRLQTLYPDTRISIYSMTTQGDRVLDRPLNKIGGKGLFVKELEEALMAGDADIAVHSMKDVPMDLPPGFEIAAIREREDPRDAFVSKDYRSLAQLPAQSRVGTSSLRRESQIRARFPQLLIEPLRGNVETRLAKLDAGNYAAIILAAAGLNRLGLADRITAILPAEESLPAPGQGALGIECRTDREDVSAMMRVLNHEVSAVCVRAERALSRALSGSCQLPLGAFAEAQGSSLRLRGFVASPDGARMVRAELAAQTDEPEALGIELAMRLKALGAAEILAALEE